MRAISAGPTLPGKSKKQIATIAHLDVVPAGNGWASNPFEMVVKDGCVIGRGTLDDKGPAVLTLYIAKFFKERGVQLPYTLRLLFGTDEETGMEDVEWYLEHYDAPGLPVHAGRRISPWATAKRAAMAATLFQRPFQAI